MRAELRDRLKCSGTYVEIEEKLANSYMLGRCWQSESTAVCRRLQSFSSAQPSGYRDAQIGLDFPGSKADFAELINTYCGIWTEEFGLDLTNSAFDLARSLEFFRR